MGVGDLSELRSSSLLGSPVVLSAELSPQPLVLAFLGQVLYYSLDLEGAPKAHASKACSSARDSPLRATGPFSA